MTTTEAAPLIRVRRRVPATIRGAQLLLLLPLGAFQLVATLVFSISDGLRGGEFILAVWAPLMALGCITVGARLGRGDARVLRAALTLLGAQIAFSIVKLAVYHESAALVFLALTAAAVALLALPATRRHFPC